MAKVQVSVCDGCGKVVLPKQASVLSFRYDAEGVLMGEQLEVHGKRACISKMAKALYPPKSRKANSAEGEDSVEVAPTEPDTVTAKWDPVTTALGTLRMPRHGRRPR